MENTFIDEQVKELLPKFEALAPYKPTDRKKGKGDDTGWYILALNATRLLKATYPDDKPELEKTYGTCLRQITALKKALKLASENDLKDSANEYPVKTIIKHFGECLSEQFAQYKIQQNAVYRDKVETRSKVENRIELDLSAFITKAYTVLLNPGNHTWLELSCALAMATGRRMSEVHMSAEFTPVPDSTHEVYFTGQLKGKSRKINGQPLHRHKFKIPTLVPANLVIEGLEILDELDKRNTFESSWSADKVSLETPRINSRFSKDLNKLTKHKDWKVLEDGMTYHKFRGAYLKACMANEPDLDPYDYLDRAREILGDRDESTIKAYQRFTVKKDSVTRIG